MNQLKKDLKEKNPSVIKMTTFTTNLNKNPICVYKQLKERKMKKTTSKWKTDSNNSYSPREILLKKSQN